MKDHAWQIAISVLASLFLLAHLIWPALKIDAITLTLFAICCIPWLGNIFKSLEMPGGWKFEFKDFAKAATQAEASGLLEPIAKETTDPIYFALLDSDPALAVVGLRIEIEKRLRRIADQHQLLDQKAAIFQLMREMEKRGILTQSECMALRDILSSLNSAAHGAEITRATAEQVLDVGSRLLESLDKRFPASTTAL